MSSTSGHYCRGVFLSANDCSTALSLHLSNINHPSRPTFRGQQLRCSTSLVQRGRPRRHATRQTVTLSLMLQTFYFFIKPCCKNVVLASSVVSRSWTFLAHVTHQSTSHIFRRTSKRTTEALIASGTAARHALQPTDVNRLSSFPTSY